MPVNGMNVGVDYQILYFESSSGQIINMGDVQNVRIIGQKHDIKSMPYNGLPRFGYVNDGYRIDFTITRTGSAIEDFFVQLNQNFNAGQVITPGFLQQNITNPDGTIRRYQYVNFVAFMTDHGDISREKTVMLKVEGMASDKIQIA